MIVIYNMLDILFKQYNKGSYRDLKFPAFFQHFLNAYVDFLKIDTEGHDYSILNNILDELIIKLLKNLDLLMTKDLKVGNVLEKTISGGQRKRLNIGLFESVLWTNSNDRGFDVNYLNPVIFYRAIEFETGQGAGNALMGASAKYKWNDNVNVYGQFILDEFSLSDVIPSNFYNKI